MRRIALWVPDWPTNALVVDAPPGAPAAVLERNTVYATTPAARRLGVRRAMPIATAHHLCPDLLILPHDEERQGRAFEAVLDCFDMVAAHVHSLRPGLAWAPAAGPVRWAGSEEKVAEGLIDQVADTLGIECQVGIASGFFTAIAAAWRGSLVPEADSATFLRHEALADVLPLIPPGDQPQAKNTVETLRALGIATCGDLVALDQSALATRFGRVGQMLRLLASGGELPRPAVPRALTHIDVDYELDEAADTFDALLLPLRAAAVTLGDRARAAGVSSHVLSLSFYTTSGQERSRQWHGIDAKDTTSIVERGRWQLRAWLDLRGSADPNAPQGPVERIHLEAHELTHTVHTAPLWGDSEGQMRTHSAATRVCSLLGEGTVLQPRLQGGYDPRSRIAYAQWGMPESALSPTDGEWRGGLDEAPATLYDTPAPIQVLGEEAPRKELPRVRPVHVTPRGTLSHRPQLIRPVDSESHLPAPCENLRELRIVETTGPWVVLGRWWEAEGNARSYLRITCTQGPDLLLCVSKGQWYLEGAYD